MANPFDGMFGKPSEPSQESNPFSGMFDAQSMAVPDVASSADESSGGFMDTAGKIWDNKYNIAGGLAKFLAPVPTEPLPPLWDKKKSTLDNVTQIGKDVMAINPITASSEKLVGLMEQGKQGTTYAQTQTPTAKAERAPGNIITKALDKTVMTPFYGLATFVDSTLANGLNVFKGAKDAVNEVMNIEAGNPDAQRLSYSDVIKHIEPQFAKDNPILTETLGLMGDLVIDPLNFIGAKEIIMPLEKGLAVLDKPIARKLLSIARGKAFEMLATDIPKAAEQTSEEAAKMQKTFAEWAAKEGKAPTPEVEKEFKSLWSNIHGAQAPEFTIKPDIPAITTHSSTKEVHDYAKRTGQKLSDLMEVFSREAKPPTVGLLDKGPAREIFPAIKTGVETNKPASTFNLLSKDLAKKGQEISALDRVPDFEHLVRENMAKAGEHLTGAPAHKIEDALNTTAELAGTVRTPEDKDLLNKAISKITETPEELLKTWNGGRVIIPPHENPDTIEATAHKLIADWVKSPEFEAGGKAFKTKDIVGKQGYNVFGATIPKGIVTNQIKKQIGPLWTHRLSSIADKVNILKPIPQELKDAAMKLRVETEKAVEESDKIRNQIYGGVINAAEEGHISVPSIDRPAGRIFPRFTNTRTQRAEAVLDNIGKAAWELDAKAQQLDRELKPVEINETFEKIFGKGKIAEQSRAAYVSMLDHSKRQFEIDKAAGLLTEEQRMHNYAHHYYTWIQNPKNIEEALAAEKVKNMGFAERHKAMSEFFVPGKDRSISTLEAARQAGYEPIFNSAEVTTRRYMMSKIAIARQDFNQTIKAIYGTDIIDEIAKKDKHAASALRFIGDSNFSTFMPDEAPRTFLKLWDKGLNAYRKLGTVVGPAFAPKNIVQNSLQIVMGQGIKGFGVFDPRNIQDSIIALSHVRGLLDEANPLLDKMMTGSPLLKGMTLRKMLEEAKAFEVIKGTDMSSTQRAVKNATQGLIDYSKFGEPGQQGLKRVVDGLVHYTRWPSNVEDTMRFATFMNARKLGYDGKQAANMTDRFLFDYNNGLNAVERQWIRRFAAPYYSFPRFATELFAKTLIAHPTRVTGMYKSAQHFLNVWEMLHTHDTLTEDEQRVVDGSGWIVEQPHVFKGFDKNMRAQFDVFNNFSPLDIFGNMVEDPDGSVNLAKTAQHVFLAQLGPHFKMILEPTLNKNFFTDQIINDPNKPGKKMGEISPDVLFSRIAAALTAAGSGNAAIAAATGMGLQQLGKTDPVKQATKWILQAQEIVNPQTGKKETYINPWLWYFASTAFPKLNIMVRTGRQDYSPTARTLELMAGIGTLNADIRQQYSYQVKAKKETARDLLAQYHSMLRLGATSSAQDRLEAFQRMQQLLDEQLQSTDYSNLRGQ